jgi:hypothetical protein
VAGILRRKSLKSLVNLRWLILDLRLNDEYDSIYLATIIWQKVRS